MSDHRSVHVHLGFLERGMDRLRALQREGKKCRLKLGIGPDCESDHRGRSEAPRGGEAELRRGRADDRRTTMRPWISGDRQRRPLQLCAALSSPLSSADSAHSHAQSPSLAAACNCDALLLCPLIGLCVACACAAALLRSPPPRSTRSWRRCLLRLTPPCRCTTRRVRTRRSM